MAESSYAAIPGLAANLTGSLSCGTWPKVWRVSIYVAYSDETGTSNPTGAFVVGGYIAPEKDWPDFSKNWSAQVLNPVPSIPYLHMVELRGKEFRQEHGLTWEDSLEKTKLAVECITSHSFVRRYFGTINRGALIRRQTEIKQSGFEYPKHTADPDYMCFIAYVFALIRDIAENVPDASRVNFMVSRKKHISHYCAKFRDEVRKWFLESSPSLAKLIGDLIPISMDEHMPLQAADCFLWHLQRAYSNSLEPEDEKNLTLMENMSGLGKEWQPNELEVFGNGLIQPQ